MDVAGVRRARTQDIDPQAVEGKASALAQVEIEPLGEGDRVPIEAPLEIGERRGAAGQVVELRVGGVAAVAVGAAPGATGAVLGG